MDEVGGVIPLQTLIGDEVISGTNPKDWDEMN